MKNIIVVEDGHAEQRIMNALLTQAGFEVALASNVDEAWQWLETNIPNLVILDIVMPGKSGLELCRMIQGKTELSQIPIVFCSSKSEEFDRFWAMRQGAKAYLIKPYAPKELLDMVYQQIR